MYREIQARHRYDHLADENPGIAKLLGPLGDAGETTLFETWQHHLATVLRFPFDARVEDQLRRGPIRLGEVVRVMALEETNEVDDMYGIVVNVQTARGSYALPLCDLSATDSSSKNYHPLRDYAVWFANR